jgi:hypothetical protein
MDLYNEIILGDGPVSRILQRQISLKGTTCLVLDCGPGLKHLIQNIDIDSNVRYLAKEKAPSLNPLASEAMWAGGLQGWPLEDLVCRRSDGLPLIEYLDSFRKNSRQVAKILGVRNFDFESNRPKISFRLLRGGNESGLKVIFCKVLKDPRLNKIGEISNSSSKIKTYRQFIATNIEVNPEHITVFGIHSRSGAQLAYSCRKLTLAMGTIENTRILINSQKELNLSENKFLGRYLSDHLTFRIATFETNNLARIIRHFSRPKTLDGCRLWPRIKFEKNIDFLSSNSFGHIDNFRFLGRMTLVYRLFRKLGLENLYFGFHRKGEFDFHLFVEKQNEVGNKIVVSESDKYKIAPLKIYFKISDREVDALSNLTSTWISAITNKYPEIRLLSAETSLKLMPGNLQAGTHSSGTYRMSANSNLGVVNQKSELWSDSRIRVLGSGAFPIASATHPTFTGMVLGITDSK